MRTHEQFVKEAIVKNHNVEVIGQYAGANNKINVRCREYNKITSRKDYGKPMVLLVE